MSDADVFDGLVKVTRLGPQGMITLRGDLDASAVQGAVADVARTEIMPGQRGARVSGGHGVLWMSPDELMILVPHRAAAQAVDALENALAGEHALAVDVSDARVCFQLQGTKVREVLAKLVPVDLAPGRFAPGEIRRTHFAQVAGAFWLQDENTAQVICFRSVGDYMHRLLMTAADRDAPVHLWTK